MIFDLNEVSPGVKYQGYDVCIAGAGVAGITLATDLAAHGRRVLLLEAGGFEFTDTSQKIYYGNNVGRPYFRLHEARLRYLGGTSNHWNGWCRPLDDWDYKNHDHIPHSGWPIAKNELDRFLERASHILEISPQYSDQVIRNSANTFTQIEFQRSPPVRFKNKYHRKLRDSKQIDVFLNANLVDIRLAEMKNRVVELRCANYLEPSPLYTFAGKTFVLAMGGIENPRMLLNFQRQLPTGIGNSRDIVGRYFMDHFHVLGGYYTTKREVWPFSNNKENYLAITPVLMAQQKIANAGLRIGPITGPDSDSSIFSHAKQRFVCAEDIIRDFISNFYDVWCPTNVYIGGYVQVASEQVPNRNSRVFLSNDVDRFGLRQVALDWQITDIDRRTIKNSVIAFGRYLAERKYGNVKLKSWLLDDAEPVPGVGEDEWLGAAWHHMGTTRMASNSAEGVVDENSRVFGQDNLFIAGSSVFPTSGHANPTLTIVQLTLRLSEHLHKRLST